MEFALTREQRDIKQAAREFARGEFTPERAIEHEKNHRFPRELFEHAARLGFVGLDLPEESGGSGMGVVENVLVVEEFCKADSGIGMAIHLSWLPAKVIKLFGTPEQHHEYLKPMTEGRYISAICLTEADHGSDLSRVETRIEETGDRFVINGTKIFTTNAAQADFFVVLCQADPEAAPGKGMTTVIVDRDPSHWLGGTMAINEMPDKMGLRMTSSGEVVFKDLEVPKKNLLGEPGQGLSNILGFLAESRIEIAAQSLGNAEGAFSKALAHARARKQFGRPLIDFQAIGHILARMWSNLQSAKWALYHAAWLSDRMPRRMAKMTPLYSSSVKHQVPELAKAIIDDAITVFGGYGYFLEQEVERRYRDNRIVEIYEGTVQVQLNNIARILEKTNLDFIDATLL